MKFLSLIFVLLFVACKPVANELDPLAQAPDLFSWNNAHVYFLLTDRFYNGDPTNDYKHTDDNPPAPQRGYQGGDWKGITKKIKDGYFSDLGVDAIWLSPVVEQIEGSVDEGTGNSFGFHGYWTKDWTALNPYFGTEEDLKELVTVAHENGIRILFDIVANHTGPVTEKDPVWPEEWVRTGPRCTFASAETTISCTLVENLPDIKTDSQEEVELPALLVEKWKNEGRYEQEVAELNAWFKETGYPRTPANYILKWTIDLIKDYGVDGFRVDTVKHTEEDVWKRLRAQADLAWSNYKNKNADAVIDDEDFYLVGEVYNYFIGNGKVFDYGNGDKVDFFENGFHSLINFDFKGDANKKYDEIFEKYDSLLNNELKGYTILNYQSSHDDGGPFDLDRKKPFEAATKLLLTPGGVQTYYGDESARSLTVPADGDAKLRGQMNWNELKSMVEKNGYTVNDVLIHYQKLGKFRHDHPAVGAGRQETLSESPYVFQRSFTKNGRTDLVVVGVDMPAGDMSMPVGNAFAEGAKVRDAYSGATTVIKDGHANLNSADHIVLLELDR